MSAQLATLVCFGGIGYLFWLDRGRAKGVSKAIWIPLLWMFFAGSRFASQWWNLGTPDLMGAAAYDDGSPVDRNIFLALLISGVWVLARRRLDWANLLKRNAWVFLFFLFAAISVLWSDEPFISFKRWVKGYGNVVMALVILTEKRPSQALGYVLSRMAFILLPLSILFIRFYPELGRSYHMGNPMFTGVTFQKNSLGQLCMLLAVYFCWEVILHRSKTANGTYKPKLPVNLFVLAMLFWLLHMAQSATSLALTGAVTCFFLVARLEFFTNKPTRLIDFLVVFAGIVALLEQFFHIKDAFIRMLGREPDLTDRLPVWEMVVGMVPNAWLGAGYESFWSGTRMVEIWTRMGNPSGGILQAHNGYIDMYVNLGIIGVAILVTAILSGLWKARGQLKSDYAYAGLKIAFILIGVVYNYTEAAFKPLNNVFILLLFSIINVPLNQATRTSRRPAPPIAHKKG